MRASSRRYSPHPAIVVGVDGPSPRRLYGAVRREITDIQSVKVGQEISEIHPETWG